ncbi:Trigger factor [Senna tora]|uniref:peptidylprolyl isomerase n=1 Tax=Senna tora TaxID=362788 RepID=A0A834WPW5_9FABA|nr:Trigger factor [Senna tora]
MNTASQTFILNLAPQMTRYKQRVDGFLMPGLNPRSLCLSNQLRYDAGELFKRHHCSLNFSLSYMVVLKHIRSHSPVALISEDAQISSGHFEDFSVSSTNINDVGELKISIEVSGTKTQRIFDDVFEKMVAAAQPIPGFRRVKGGEIPKHVLLEVLGPSKVFKEVIKKIINSTVAEYVEKEQLKVGKDLRVEQSFEDLEAEFEAGDNFSFDAVVQLQEQN